MKKLLYIVLIALVAACSNPQDCFQSVGNIVQQEVTGLAAFDRIIVERDVELIISQGPLHSVVVESGDKLIDDVEVTSSGGLLIVADNNTCNYVRDYNVTKVYVTTPTLTQIRNSSQFSVRSEGTLSFPDLELRSEDTGGDFNNVGEFYLDVNTVNLTITSNNHSNYFISGVTDFLRVGFVSGGGRFEGADLIAREVNVFHRGYNDIIVNPQEHIWGEIRSTGDVIAKNQPVLVEVEEYYTGRLIFD